MHSRYIYLKKVLITASVHRSLSRSLAKTRLNALRMRDLNITFHVDPSSRLERQAAPSNGNEGRVSVMVTRHQHATVARLVASRK